MRKILTSIILFASSVFFASAAETTIEPSATYLYQKRDTCDLFLDVYDPAPGSIKTFNGKEKPSIVFIFGGEVLRGFAFALFIGVAIGAFASLCVACPIAYFTITRSEKKKQLKTSK